MGTTKDNVMKIDTAISAESLCHVVLARFGYRLDMDAPSHREAVHDVAAHLEGRTIRRSTR